MSESQSPPQAETAPQLEVISPKVLSQLIYMTDDAFNSVAAAANRPDTYTKYEFLAPDIPASLVVFSLADGQAGYNTHEQFALANEDSSRRWVIKIEDGKMRGDAFKRIGTVYEDGRFQPGSKLIDIKKPTLGLTKYTLAEVEEIISRFYRDGKFTVEFSRLALAGIEITVERVVEYMPDPDQQVKSYDTDPDTDC